MSCARDTRTDDKGAHPTTPPVGVRRTLPFDRTRRLFSE